LSPTGGNKGGWFKKAFPATKVEKKTVLGKKKCYFILCC